MKYIWEAEISTDKYKIDKWPISVLEARKDEYGNIRVNPSLRFYDMFSEILKNEFFVKDEEVTKKGEEILNIVFHILAEMDRKSYINRLDIKKELIIEDISNGLLGKSVKEKYKIFSKEELDRIAGNILELKSLDTYKLFERTVKDIFPLASKLFYFRSSERFYIYLGVEKNDKNREKIEFIKEIFWDITEDLEIYYDTHFGIIGNDITMRIDRVELA